jgi:uncharacterized protein YaaQ
VEDQQQLIPESPTTLAKSLVLHIVDDSLSKVHPSDPRRAALPVVYAIAKFLSDGNTQHLAVLSDERLDEVDAAISGVVDAARTLMQRFTMPEACLYVSTKLRVDGLSQQLSIKKREVDECLTKMSSLEEQIDAERALRADAETERDSQIKLREMADRVRDSALERESQAKQLVEAENIDEARALAVVAYADDRWVVSDSRQGRVCRRLSSGHVDGNVPLALIDNSPKSVFRTIPQLVLVPLLLADKSSDGATGEILSGVGEASV